MSEVSHVIMKCCLKYRGLDLRISVHGSSCKYILFGIILFLFTWHPLLPWGYPEIEEEKMSTNEAVKEKLHELPYTEMVKSDTFRTVSDVSCL